MRKYVNFIFALLLFTFSFSVCAFADMGPKPSVNVEFTGGQGKEYYVTLLSENDSTGPYYTAKQGDIMQNKPSNIISAAEKFEEYKDEDGYYFIQYVENCTESGKFNWTYYPPKKFKILVYFPETNSYAVSEVCERYAFHSYFKTDLTEAVSGENTVCGITTSKNYNFKKELVSLFVRIAITILAEMLIALAFGLRTKKQLLTVLGVNVLTQVVLNVLLNIINYKSGYWAFVINYVWMEAAVVAIEYFVLKKIINLEEKERFKNIIVFCYSLVSNGASFAIGLALVKIIPQIF